MLKTNRFNQGTRKARAADESRSAQLPLLEGFVGPEFQSAGDRMPATLVAVGLCGAALLTGWGLLLTSLLYVLSAFSTTVWLFSVLGLALAHAMLAFWCWRYAIALSCDMPLHRTREDFRNTWPPEESGWDDLTDRRRHR